VLVELGLVEQRYKAVCEVLDGASVTDVARRNGVARQTVHEWLRRYANEGIGALADRSSKPQSCPHQMSPVIEARIVGMRRQHPAWGPRTIRTNLLREGLEDVPGRSSVYRALLRHGLIDPKRRRRKREDYKRWERSRSMELWQMDVVGRFHLRDGTELKVITGIDDHSRYCVCARIVVRATAKPVCDALHFALEAYGVPNQILTDNGKVFTARFGKGPGPVLFDRICNNNSIRHLLTAPYSPTTTGKVERFHKTLRKEFFSEKDHLFETIEEAQRALDAWVATYNDERPHQSIGDVPPMERFKLAALSTHVADDDEAVMEVVADRTRAAGVSRWSDQRGFISLGGFRYRVGPTFVGEAVEVVVREGLVEILHDGVLVATHAERRRPGEREPRTRTQSARRARRAGPGLSVSRIVDGGGSVSFAGAPYRASRSWARKTVEVAIVAGSVQISANGKVIRVHQIRHDRSKEHGAFATPKGRPRKPKVA
jgi:transposase InsO family protein